MRRLMIINLTMMVVFLVGVGLMGAGVQAKGEDDPFPTPAPPKGGGDYGQGEQCDLPGIVVNSASMSVQILGDTYRNGELVWVQKTLYPNQRSSLYLCDTDYIGHGSLVWKFGDIKIQPKTWSNYILNTTYVCRDHTVNGRASFQCLFSNYNWGPRT